MKAIYFFTIIFLLTPPNIQAQCTHPDYAGLMELYNSTGGANWTNNTGWKDGATGTNCNPCDGWIGIECNQNRVYSINLYDNNLVGKIPNLTNLPNLIYLICAKNQLTGDIPDFTHLPQLIQFTCHNNQLTGNIPNFSNLPNLQTFWCNGNKLTGNIPNFTNLSKLYGLNCSNNQLTGNIPNFSNLPNLRYFYCSANQLTGNIPDFSNLKNLNTLYIDNNNLSGCIPEQELCLIEKRDSIVSNHNVLISNNPLLPFKGDITDLCNFGSQIGALCDDGFSTTVEDHILPNCSCLGAILDTCVVTVYDTLIFRDTITEIITDTTFITVMKEIAVTDTLVINLNLVNSINQPVMNTILVYPNPASSHIYVDMDDYTLLENYDMQILNTLGQPVYFTTIDKKLYYLDLNSWSGIGTYFLKIKNPNGTTIQTKKIVLQ